MAQQEQDLVNELEKLKTELNRLPRNELVYRFIAQFCENVRLTKHVEFLKSDIKELQDANSSKGVENVESN